jgi:hypothetical protein
MYIQLFQPKKVYGHTISLAAEHLKNFLIR